MDPKESNSKESQLMKIYEMVIRLDEKVKALVDTQQTQVTTNKEMIRELKEKIQELESRLRNLEEEGVKLNVFWKVLLVVGPILISLFLTALLKILGLG